MKNVKKLIVLLITVLALSYFVSCSLFFSYEPTDEEISRAVLALNEGLTTGVEAAIFESSVQGIDFTVDENNDDTVSIIMEFNNYEVIDGSENKYIINGTMKLLDFDIFNNIVDIKYDIKVESSSFGGDIEILIDVSMNGPETSDLVVNKYTINGKDYKDNFAGSEFFSR